MGTPELAVPVLAALMKAGHQVVAAYCQPDKPAGRGQLLEPPPVKVYAAQHSLPVLQPPTLRSPEAQVELAALKPDAIVVAAYGKLLPPEVLAVPSLACLNIHPSLLPKYRGPSPVATAILNGDPVTGVTIMKLDEGMDSGPILSQQEAPIGPDETADALTARLFAMGAALLVEALPTVAAGKAVFRPQDKAQTTLTRKLSKEDGLVDWSKPAAHIARQVRAYHPWPGTYTHWDRRMLKLIEAAAEGTDSRATAGRILGLGEAGLGVATGEGVLYVRRLQEEGRRAVSAKEFLAGHPDFVGATLGR
ncbi:MAG: methionyl-tRNA formyltransferase [SAR202 cluster bacterium]|nr:methionyl-tRNA formyltransferase [SAR202 cluster bacterium]